MGLIQYLIFDVDNTLLDFDLSLMTTQKVVADRIGYPFTEEYYLTDRDLMVEAWNDYRMTETHDLEIQEHWHRHFRMQIVRHYELLMERLGMNADPYELLKLNFETISGMHYTMEAVTLDVFRDLSRTYKNVIATNCVKETKGRLSIFEPYCYRIFLSDEIHAIKPTATFFNAVLNSLGCRPEECMMIGDSAADDMAGGKRAGLHTCWYRPGKDQKICPDADFRIQSITEPPLLLEEING